MGIKLNTDGFNRALMKYIEASNKGVAQVLNAKAFDLCATAMSYTPRDRKSVV